MANIDHTIFGSVRKKLIDMGDGTYAERIHAGDLMRWQDGRGIRIVSSLGAIFSDDFGGAALDTANNWTVLDGGLGANPNLGSGTLTQSAIGSQVTGMTYSVTSSALSVVMGTAASSELWLLSKQTFAGKEDILLTLAKSQMLAANSIRICLVEVDPVTGVPLLNPNLAGDFTNKGGAEFGQTTSTTAYYALGLGDSSPAEADGNTGTAVSAWTTPNEVLIEIDSRDIIVSTATVDAVSAKSSSASRVSTQCPNDKKVYKLLLRFRNVSAPASSTTVSIGRVLVIDNYEQRVQVSSGEGDQIGAKALAANIISMPSVVLNTINPFASPSTANNVSKHKLISTATVNATSVKASGGRITGGILQNTTSSWLYFHLYNKASAPTVGTDVPVSVIGIPPNGQVLPAEIDGIYSDCFTAGIAYGITAGAADTDTTAVTAGAVIVNLKYV
jgi:hypothetical protein